MSHILLIYQNNEACKGFSEEDKDVPMHAAGAGQPLADPLAGRRQPIDVDAHRPDGQHLGIEIRALMPGDREEA